MTQQIAYKMISTVALLALMACNQKPSQEGRGGQAKSKNGQSNQNGGDAPDRKDGVIDYPPRYCSNVRKLRFKPGVDVEEELSYFCRGNEPTKEMLELRALLLKEPDKLEIKKIFGAANPDEETSEFKMVWGYYVTNTRPYLVKAAPLYSYIAKNMSDEVITINSKGERLPDDAIDYGLHLWTANMEYDLQINAAEGIVLSSKRGTQYNLYQVESGNEEMGFGVEHLVDGNKGDYSVSRMVNLSMNDGKGFNDGAGGTVVLTMLHLKMSNRGFPETTEKAIDKLGYFFAKSMFDGLKQKK